MRRAAGILVVLALASSAGGQWGPTVVPRDPIDANAKLPALAFTRLRIETKVLANLAETRPTLTIYNPHSAAVEGDLHFALPPGAAVNDYALDVNGQMVDGVAVDKEEGRRVFDDIVVRQRRDPGLIEQAGRSVAPNPPNQHSAIIETLAKTCCAIHSPSGSITPKQKQGQLSFCREW
jgi:hypothetical protein